MSSSDWGAATDMILLALREHGPMTREQLQVMCNVEKYTAGQIVSRITKVVKRGPLAGSRRAHIASWTSHGDHGRDYLRAVYAIGDKPDAPRPPPKCMLKVKREYWERRKQRLQMFTPGADLQSAWLGKSK